MYKEYNFPTLFQTAFRLFKYRKIETINIKLNNNKILIEKGITEKEKKNGLLFRKDFSNTEKNSQEFNLEDLLYIKIKSIWIPLILCVILFVFFASIYEKLNLQNKANIMNVSNISNNILNLGIVLIITFVFSIAFIFLLGISNKKVELCFRGNEKISFQYYIWNKSKAKEFLNDMRYLDVKIKNLNIRNNIIITVLIMLNIFYINIQFNQIYTENKLVTALLNNTYYVDIIVEKGKIIECNKSKYNLMKNTYLLERTGQKIDIEENIGRNTNDIYNIFILKYYLRDTNELIKTKYEAVAQGNETSEFVEYNKDYYYEQSSKKIYEFTIPEFDILKERNNLCCTVDFYINENKSPNTDRNSFEDIYKFVISDLNEQKVENNKYNKFEKIGEFKSKYGVCNVIKAHYKNNSYKTNCNDYLVFIQNNDGNHVGIFLKYREDINGIKSNYMDYFKTILTAR